MTPHEMKSKQKELKITNRDLSKKLGISAQTITNWRVGRYFIPDWLESIFELLTIDKHKSDSII